MKTYKEAILKIAQDAHDNHLSGGSGRAEGYEMVAFIYGVSPKRVYADVALGRKYIWDKQIAANKKKYPQ